MATVIVVELVIDTDDEIKATEKAWQAIHKLTKSYKAIKQGNVLHVENP